MRVRRCSSNLGEPDGLSSSGADCDSILNLGDARRPPSHLLGLLALCPRPNAAFESHLATVCLDGDVFRVDFRIAAKGFLDLALDFGGRDLRFHYDQIGDALDASDASNRVLGPRR